MNKFCVLGAGSWGTAVANVLAKENNCLFNIWVRESEVAESINSRHENNIFLPKIKLSKNIKAETEIMNVLAKIAFVAVPSQYMRSVLQSYLDTAENLQIDKNKLGFVICSKGIELQSGCLPSEIVHDLNPKADIAILSGPSFAKLVSDGLPTAVTIAGKKAYRDKIVKLIAGKTLRPYMSDDIIGVQINGALKNIVAIAAGITDGMSLGENARAAIISRGLNEIKLMSLSLGGGNNTVMGLSGVGDVILTCTSSSSRNYSLGKLIGKGENLSSILDGKLEIAEGVDTAESAHYLSVKLGLDTPIISAVYHILKKNKQINEVVINLLNRPYKKE